MTDAIDALAGAAPGSFLDTLRRRKPVTRDNAQASFDALFAPEAFGGVSAVERAAVAAFVAGLHADAPGTRFYAARLLASGAPDELGAAVAEAAQAGAASGPFGRYPAGPLSREDLPGPDHAVPPAGRAVLGERLCAALEHAHMLVFHPRDAAPERLHRLQAAGWSADDIVTLSQLVAFLSFQLRAAAGLRALDASRGDASPGNARLGDAAA